MTWRWRAIHLLWLALVLGISLRLAYWQIVKADDLSSQAAFQRELSLEIPSPRGEILASDNFPSATNQDGYLFFINPRQFSPNIKQSKQLQDLLSSSDSAKLLLGKSYSQLSWYLVARHLPTSIKEAVGKLNLTGLGFEPDPSRFYPEASTSSHLLGFVGQDESGRPKGYFGLEGFYNRQLTGKPGKLVQEKDALDRPILIGDQSYLSPQPGSILITSIDRVMQFIAYQKLSQGLIRYGAKSGTVTIMEPATGRILAMVALPDYDPARYQFFASPLYTNPVISAAYEPGSTFKILVMAAALDARVVSPDTTCNICVGPVSVSDYTIKTWNEKYYPDSSMTEVIQHSDNVGMTYVSRKLGQAKMLEYLNRFGLGQPTGVDLQEETSPRLRPGSQWVDIDLATASFGQGIAVTPLQMVRATAVLANRGKMPTPKIVDRIITGVTIKDIPPAKVIPVISSLAAAQITKMMINAVDKGESKWAKPEGYVIAGKTGTAQIPVSGHYDLEKTIASFVGFAPAIDPKFVMLVTLTEPQTSPWGSETAAPLWFDIARDIFRLLK